MFQRIVLVDGQLRVGKRASSGVYVIDELHWLAVGCALVPNQCDGTTVYLASIVVQELLLLLLLQVQRTQTKSASRAGKDGAWSWLSAEGFVMVPSQRNGRRVCRTTQPGQLGRVVVEL